MILDKIVSDKKKRLIEHKAAIGEEKMKEQALACTRKSCSFFDALAKPGLSIIGEFKQASPSLGMIGNQLDLTERIGQYNRSVDAISCLTEEDHFQGNVDDFRRIRKISPLPMLRKDFIIDTYQIYEAKVIGADALLLIAAILSDEEIREYYALSRSLGMDVLLEVHDEEEMKRALKQNIRILGVNNRNLKDFTISLETTKRLSRMLPEGKIFISESGVTEKQEVEYLRDCQVNGLLIGRAFMESVNPRELAAEWKAVFDQTKQEISI